MKLLFESIIKYFIVSLFIGITSFCFFGCKSDMPVDSSPFRNSNIYNFTTMYVPHDTIIRMAAGDSHTAFIETLGHVYQIKDGVTTDLSNTDTTFSCNATNFYDANYFVMSGYKSPVVNGYKIPQFKIYNNGVFTKVNFQDSSLFGYNVVLYTVSPGKFYFMLYQQNKLYLFDNGIVTSYSLNSTPGTIFKSQGNLYLYANSSPGSGNDIYKITNEGVNFLRREPIEMHITQYRLENDLIKVRTLNNENIFSYFTENDWTDFYTFNTESTLDRIWHVTGESRNKFVMILNDSNSIFSVYAWDRNILKKQENFPEGIGYGTTTGYITASDYKDNTFYFYYYNVGGRLVRGNYVRN
ncbi:MAG: hypothetical protein JST55_00080 [Bacteroidetes bacterium]|nr:hypothetical protein [Bacteroidota bacterium]